MIKNNLFSMFSHTVIMVISAMLFFVSRQACINSSTARFWLYTLFFALAVALYIITGVLLKPQNRWYKNLISLLLPIAAGLVIFFMNSFSYEVGQGVRVENGLYLIYNIAFTPILSAYSFVFKGTGGYQNWWIVFSFIPTLLIWLGLQMKSVNTAKTSTGYLEFSSKGYKI